MWISDAVEQFVYSLNSAMISKRLLLKHFIDSVFVVLPIEIMKYLLMIGKTRTYNDYKDDQQARNEE